MALLSAESSSVCYFFPESHLLAIWIMLKNIYIYRISGCIYNIFSSKNNTELKKNLANIKPILCSCCISSRVNLWSEFIDLEGTDYMPLNLTSCSTQQFILTPILDWSWLCQAFTKHWRPGWIPGPESQEVNYFVERFFLIVWFGFPLCDHCRVFLSVNLVLYYFYILLCSQSRICKMGGHIH